MFDAPGKWVAKDLVSPRTLFRSRPKKDIIDRGAEASDLIFLRDSWAKAAGLLHLRVSVLNAHSSEFYQVPLPALLMLRLLTRAQGPT